MFYILKECVGIAKRINRLDVWDSIVVMGQDFSLGCHAQTISQVA
jgi:hypothetical protein